MDGNCRNETPVFKSFVSVLLKFEVEIGAVADGGFDKLLGCGAPVC